MQKITLNINQQNHELMLSGNETLLEVLRNQLGLTGTKTACDESECGTCTVQINGKAVLSCIAFACDLQGDKIETIEGVASGERLHPVQQAYLDYGAVQCGYCIPGMIMSTKALLEKNPQPSQIEIEYALDGNICRCGGYPKIFDAVKKAGDVMKSGWESRVPLDGEIQQGREILEGITCGITYDQYVKSLNAKKQE